MKKINQAFKIKKKYGSKYLISLIANYVLRKLKLFDAIQLHKEKICCDAKTIFGDQIAFGIFKGMKLSSNVWWGRHDILAKYLGQYEPHILQKLEDLSNHYEHVINIGAADGYYSVGLLYSKLYSSVTCFEISSKGRDAIAENAELNNCKDKIFINKEANLKTLKKEIEVNKSSVLLCDIEGAEFDLFSKEILSIASQCTIIIELHDEFTFGDIGRRKRLINDAEEYFDISFIRRFNPKINEFDQLSQWDDNSRHLAFSEGRPCRMDWLCLNPKKTKITL